MVWYKVHCFEQHLAEEAEHILRFKLNLAQAGLLRQGSDYGIFGWG